MDLKNFLAKTVSVLLLISSFYHTVLSVITILFVYPQLNIHSPESLLLQQGLVEKALVIYATMIIDGFYGAFLFFRPSHRVEVIHLVIGIIITLASLFLVVKTPFTNDPVLAFIANSFWGFFSPGLH